MCFVLQANVCHTQTSLVADSSHRYHTPHHNHFMALYPGPPGWAGARKELLDFMVQGKINRDRHTDHPAGHHSIRTNQCPPPPSPQYFYGRMQFLLPNRQCQSTDNIDNIRQWLKVSFGGKSFPQPGNHDSVCHDQSLINCFWTNQGDCASCHRVGPCNWEVSTWQMTNKAAVHRPRCRVVCFIRRTILLSNGLWTNKTTTTLLNWTEITDAGV